jgi:DeoR/GlpR family transcriptional regulator of sugar metabolism
MRYARTFAIAKRLNDLLALIKSGHYSSPTLAEKLRVSEQTVYRDILCLKGQGHAIRAIRKSHGWAYQLDPNGSQGLRRKGRRSR